MLVEGIALDKVEGQVVAKGSKEWARGGKLNNIIVCTN
jgi:hypothetical protein